MFTIERFKRCDGTAEETMASHLLGRAKHYMDHQELFSDALTWLKSREIAVPGYSTLQKVISAVVNNEETRLAHVIKKHLPNKEDFLQLLIREKANTDLMPSRSWPNQTSLVRIKVSCHAMRYSVVYPSAQTISFVSLLNSVLATFATSPSDVVIIIFETCGNSRTRRHSSI